MRNWINYVAGAALAGRLAAGRRGGRAIREPVRRRTAALGSTLPSSSPCHVAALTQ